MKTANARLAVVNSLTDILGEDIHPKDAIERNSEGIDRRDRAFVMEVVYGVLRNLYSLDMLISRFVRQPGKLGIRTRHNLRASVYQIFRMNVPCFAAVNEAVETEKRLKGKPPLVNAVLRNILRKNDSLSLAYECKDPVKEISINSSHPEWMIRRWIKRFSIDETRALAEANNTFPGLTIRTNTLRISRDELLERLLVNGIDASPTPFSPEGIRLGRDESYQDLSGFHGMFTVQDEASQLIVHLLAPKPGEKVLDACAAPGGKTSHIAQLMQDRGSIMAADKDDFRLSKLRDNLSATGISSVRIVNIDASMIDDLEGFDRILLDAPCSSTGVIRRNPDIRYKRKEQDLAAFGMTQALLLRSAAGLLRPNGKLVYSVCSTEPEEGEMIISDFLKANENFRIIETAPAFLKRFMAGGFFRTFPHKDNMDGFFGVILCRKR